MELKLDRIDCRILEVLQNDARLSNKELAAEVGLAPSSCLERVKKLRDSGVLRGYHAEVQPEAFGVGLQALIFVRLKQHSRDRVAGFFAHAQALPEVLAVFHVTGAHDFVVHVAVRDTHHLRDLALDAFTTREEVAQLETSLIFESAKSGHLPNYLDAAPKTGGSAR